MATSSSIALAKAKKDLTTTRRSIRSKRVLIKKEKAKIIKRAALIKRYTSQLNTLLAKEKKLRTSISSLTKKVVAETKAAKAAALKATTIKTTIGRPIVTGPAIITGPTIKKDPVATLITDPTKIVTQPINPIATGTINRALALHKKKVTAMNDRYPVLFFPIRIETKFVGRKLYVRVFPDEIFVKNLERDLTEAEKEESTTFWKSIHAADSSTASNEEKTTEKMTAVNELISALGKDRGAWAIKKNWPTNLNIKDIFSDKKLFKIAPRFRNLSLKKEDWTKAAYTDMLPDRFSFHLYDAKGNRAIEKLGNIIKTDIQLGFDPTEDLVKNQLYQKGLKWMFDFNEAVKVGLGAIIPLTTKQVRDGFSKLSVVGVKYSKNENQSSSLVKELFENHQFKADGMGLVDIGKATQNVEYPDLEKQEQSELDTFIDTHLRGEVEGVNELSTDGERLVEALGFNSSDLANVENRTKVDISNSVEMGKILWPSTIEYYLNQFSANTYSHSRNSNAKNFYLDHVSGRGLLPTVRVGDQAYGVTATSSFSGWRNSSKATFGEILLESILDPLYQNVFKPKSEKNISDAEEAYKALSANASSKSYNARSVIGKNIMTDRSNIYLSMEDRTKLVNDLEAIGIDQDDVPDILEYTMESETTPLTGPIVDSGKVFSNRTLQSSDSNGANIFTLMFESKSFKDIINHRFNNKLLVTNKDSLLYLYVRYAYLREAVKSSLNYLEPDNLSRAVALLDTEFDTLRTNKKLSEEMVNYMSLTETSVVKSEPKFKSMISGLNIKSAKAVKVASPLSIKKVDTFLSSEVTKSLDKKMSLEVPTSKWDYLNNSFASVTGKASMGDFLFAQMNKSKSETAELKALRAALGNLKDLNVRELENLFSEHIDLTSHRLDAWLLGVVNERLMNNRKVSKYETGIYFGAYGFVENLKKDKKSSTDEQGYIHAPSRDQAKVAAIARSGFSDVMKEMLSDSKTLSALEDLSIDITSKRIHTSLSIIDGINNGQDVRALLGFQFERGLSELKLASYILPFRKKYGTVSSISVPGNKNDYKANNTVDGKKIVEAFQKSTAWSAGILASTDTDYANVKSVVADVDDSLDGFSDLMHVECLYQMIKSDYSGLAALLKSLNDFERIPEPEFIKTHVHALKHENRVAVLFSEQGNKSMWGNSTYKSTLNPWVNEWLGNLLPAHDSILVHVSGSIEKSDNSVVLIDEALSIEDLMSVEPIDFCASLPANNLLKKTFVEQLVKLAISNRETNITKWNEFNLDIKSIPAIKENQYSLFEVDFIVQQANTILKNGRSLLAKDLANNIEKDDLDNSTQSDLSTSLRTLNAQMGKIKSSLTKTKSLSKKLLNGNATNSPARFYVLFDHLLTEALKCNLSGFPKIDPVYTKQNSEALLAFSKANSSQLETLQTSLSKEIDELEEPTLSEVKRIISMITIDGEYVTIPFKLKTNSEIVKTYSVQKFDNITSDFKVNDWLYTASKVKENLTAVILLDQVAIGAKPVLNLSEVKQLPYSSGESNVWMGTDYTDEVDSSRISFVLMSCESSVKMNGKLSGILVADWDEQIPIKNIDTGVAFNYDAPNAKSPKNILLGVSPHVTGKWDWNDLSDMIDETLALSKIRSVTLDDLAGTVVERFVPMTVAPVIEDDESPSLNFLNNNK